jgi:hypothetical protein
MIMTETRWKWADLVVKTVGVAIITGAVSLYGIKVQNAQERIAADAAAAQVERDRKDRKMNALVEFASAQKKLDVDVGTELFRAFIDKYFDLSSDNADQIRENIVLLRLIALNFQDVPINLKPLFQDLDGRVARLESAASVDTAPGTGSMTKSVARELRVKLQEIAKEVANRQAIRLTFLSGGLIDFEKAKVGQILFFGTVPFAVKVLDIAGDTVEVELLETELNAEFQTEVIQDGRRIGPFTITYFDMPILDNVKVDKETRLAVQLTALGDGSASLRGVTFHADLATDRFDVKEMSRDIIEDIISEKVSVRAGSAPRM